MPLLLLYLFKVSISLTAVYIFYQLVLRRLTFYNWNRWYLLVYTSLSFLVPFIDITPVLEKNEMMNNMVINWIPVFRATQQDNITAGSEAASSFSVLQLLNLLIIAGIITMLIRMVIQFISYRKMKCRAEYLFGDAMKVYQVNEAIIPFSFGNTIFINRNLHTPAELEEIIRHEFVHVRQRHSIDIIWSELLCLLCWFNPFAWLLKRSVRQNLEFIADHKVLENGINKKEYQYLLLKVTGNNLYSIATPFNFSSLKKRIAMMNKMKTAKLHLLRFLFILPLLAVILVSFRKEFQKTAFGTNSKIPGTALKDTIPQPPPPPAAPKWKKLPDNIKGVNVNNDKVTIILKNGTKEKYDLNNPDEKKALEKKYGDILPPPPPPPPPPALPAGVKDISLNKNNIISVTKENGSVEKFDLNNKEEKNTFENKYQGIMPATSAVPLAGSYIEASGFPMVELPLAATTVSGVRVKASSNPLNEVAVQGYPIATAVKGQQIPSSELTEVVVSGYPVIRPVAPVVGSASGNVLLEAPGGEMIEADDVVKIVITKDVTREQLNEYIKQMKQYGVDLTYDEIGYDPKGHLKKLSVKLKSSNNMSSFSGNNFMELILLYFKKGDRSWFRINVIDDNNN